MFEVADKIILDCEIALVHRRHPGKRIHVFENFAVVVMNDDALPIAIGEPFNLSPISSLGDLLDGEIELVTSDEVDRSSSQEALFGLDRYFRSD